MKGVPAPTVKRLVLYYHYLEELIRNEREQIISSVEMGKGVGVSGAQVRKDLSYFGSLGCKGVGYQVSTLRKQLSKIIGFNQRWPVVLIGAGNLGRALVYYDKFRELGLEIVEIFDCDLNKIGNRVANIPVKSNKEMDELIRRKGIKISVIAVPAEEAQQVAESLVRAGIQAIWNFAPVYLKLSKDVVVIAEDLSSGIGCLIYNLKNII